MAVSKLIQASRALRKLMREQASQPSARLFAPGLVASVRLVDQLLEEVEDLDDRVGLLEIANGTYLIGERATDAASS